METGFEYLVTPEVVSLARKLDRDLEDIGVQLNKVIDFLDEMHYKDYKRARMTNDAITVQFLEGIFKPEDCWRYEERMQNELKG